MNGAATAAGALVLVAGFVAGAFVLGSGATATATGCGAAVVAASGQTGEVAGYSGDQLENAAAIMNAAATLGLDRQAQIIGVMTAMGESSLHNIDYGDLAGPDSRGLFQQRDSWGTLAQRMDPTTAATLFYERLVGVEGWQTMAPTLAIHEVQRNADANHYARYEDEATAVVEALAGEQGPGCVRLEVDGDAQQLAIGLVERMDAGTLAAANGAGEQIRNMAAGTARDGCRIDTRILQVITIAAQTFDSVGVSSINRHCTGTIVGAGTASRHWIDGGGHAVDFYAFNGTPTTGADANALQLVRILDPVMPPGSIVGQKNCRAAAGTSLTLSVFAQITDTCHHLHVDVDPASTTLLATG